MPKNRTILAVVASAGPALLHDANGESCLQPEDLTKNEARAIGRALSVCVAQLVAAHPDALEHEAVDQLSNLGAAMVRGLFTRRLR